MTRVTSSKYHRTREQVASTEQRRESETDKQFTYNVTSRRVHETTVAVDNNQYYIFLCVCVCVRVSVCGGGWMGG